MWDMLELRKIAGLAESTKEVIAPAKVVIVETQVAKPINRRKAIEKNWNYDSLINIAGITESFDDDSDDDSDEDEDVKRAEQELKKRKIKLPKTADVDVDKDIEDLAARNKARNEATKAAKAKRAAKAHAEHEKSETPPKEKAEHDGKMPTAAEEKKETSAEEKKEEVVAKRKGKAPQEGSKSGQLRKWISEHPGAPRKEAWAWAQTIDPPFTRFGFSTIYQAAKSKMVKECYILRHPTVPTFILSENEAMGMYTWISESDVNQLPVVVKTEAEALKIGSYLRSFKNQLSTVERVQLED